MGKGARSDARREAVVNRNAAFALTHRDIEAVKGATLGTHGIKQKDGSW